MWKKISYAWAWITWRKHSNRHPSSITYRARDGRYPGGESSSTREEREKGESGCADHFDLGESCCIGSVIYLFMPGLKLIDVRRSSRIEGMTSRSKDFSIHGIGMKSTYSTMQY